MGPGEHIPLTLGTAGHVDHGKTALIEALTGVNTDRLAEERRRGLSIELGFAELELDDGHSVGVVDVPGHERFIRTMVAGATGVDMFLLVVAADEGVMPQTREHVAVLEALEVGRGVIALTKCDRADDDARSLAGDEARALLPQVPLVEVSAVTGVGLDRLRAELTSLAAEIEEERAGRGGHAAGPVVLHVDRSFTLRGIGTVVTGTLWSGPVSPGERVRVLPRDLDARVRRVQVHHGTRAAPARAVDLGDGLAQLRLESPLVARSGDRLVLRGIAPAGTIGGGRVLDPTPRRHGPRSNARDRLLAIREQGLDAVVAEETRRHAEAERARSARRHRAAHAERRRPLDDRARVLLALLEADGPEPRPPRALGERIGIAPRDAVAGLDRLVAHDEAVRVAPDVYYATGALEELRARALELARIRGEITLPELRDALGTSRKYAQELLEHLDATKVTVRHGDRHVLRRVT